MLISFTLQDLRSFLVSAYSIHFQPQRDAGLFWGTTAHFDPNDSNMAGNGSCGWKHGQNISRTDSECDSEFLHSSKARDGPSLNSSIGPVQIWCSGVYTFVANI